jgi:hypothetical protein
MEDIVDHTKDLLGVEDSDEKKAHDIKQKKAEGESTHRERLELKDIKQKKKDQEQM